MALHESEKRLEENGEIVERLENLVASKESLVEKLGQDNALLSGQLE